MGIFKRRKMDSESYKNLDECSGEEGNNPSSNASGRDVDFDAGSPDTEEGIDAMQENNFQSDSELNAEIENLRAEVIDCKDKYVRTLADFENYKKRTLKERSELLKYQGDKVFFDILEVLDNFELALKYTDTDYEKLRSGLELIHKMFLDILNFL